jgi:hypothetical protein
MPSVEERYEAATAYVRRAVAIVEAAAVGYINDPITGLVEWYAGRNKTEPARNELARIEARWLRAASDVDRARIARDAELLADRTQESLPGAPQNRQRTNLYKGEQQESKRSTSYYGEVASQAEDHLDWAIGKVSDGAKSIGKWLLVGGGLVLGWSAFSYLRERELRSRTRRLLNENLERTASR